MIGQCHYVAVKGVGKVFIAGCDGGAVHGRPGCTCTTAEGRPAPIQLRRETPQADLTERATR
ncbi:MAG: hypothetical protein LDL44_19750 [Caenispirillum sp.]|nr:hypothetical protein [Caenispirillum sp.]